MQAETRGQGLLKCIARSVLSSLLVLLVLSAGGWAQGLEARGQDGVGMDVLGINTKGLSEADSRRALVVGLDARNGVDAASRLARGSDFDQLRGQIVARGLSLRFVHGFTADQLRGLDLLILRQPIGKDQLFSAQEREAIQDFVADGAALLVHGDLRSAGSLQSNSLNQLLGPYGVAFGSTQTGGVLPGRERRTWVVDALVPHPITRGVSAFRVDFPRSIIAMRSPARSLTRNLGPNGVLVAVDQESAGRVVVIGDASLWADPDVGNGAGLDAPGNRVLLGNLLSHLLARPLPPILPELGKPVNSPGLQVQLADLRDAWLGMPSQALAVLRLLIPEGASSGCFVEMSLSGARPGALLFVLLGEPTEAGTLANPHLLETVMANAAGRVTAFIPVPASAAGHTFGLRLLDPVSGETSSVMRFEPSR